MLVGAGFGYLVPNPRLRNVPAVAAAMKMSRFTISLQSNSSIDLYLDNMVSQWKTKLREFIKLEDKWEVGLLKVLFPGKVYNIFGSDFGFTMQVGLLNNVCVLKVGIYKTIVSSVQNESGLHYSAVGRRQRASSIPFFAHRNATQLHLWSMHDVAPRCLSPKTWRRCLASGRINDMGTREPVSRRVVKSQCS